ncbi:hypothetical protein J6590_045816 [Homalodisca vitripennis]|nr:hypothetical protein J6590_045816 [Homalodisca vitripennis]
MAEVVVGEVRSRLPRIAGRYRSPSHLAARSEVEKKTALVEVLFVVTFYILNETEYNAFNG